jgi:hypothetical protein
MKETVQTSREIVDNSLFHDSKKNHKQVEPFKGAHKTIINDSMKSFN